MVTAEELTVAIRSTGVNETRQDLEGVESAMEDTADSAGDSAAELQGFSQTFKGAMATAVAALAIGAAGVLSKIPVLGETGSALQAILGSVTRSIDDEIRPAMSRFNQDLFEVAREAENAEGPFNTITTAVDGFYDAVEDASTDTLQQEIENLTGITVPENFLDFGFEVFTLQFRDAFGTAQQIVRNEIDDMAAQVATLEDAFGETGASIIRDGIEFVDGFVDEVSSLPREVVRFFTGLGESLAEWGGNIAQDAREWGSSIIQQIIEGISSGIDDLQEQLDELSSISDSVDIDLPSFDDLSDFSQNINTGGNGGDAGNGGNGDLFDTPNLSNLTGGDTNINLDGRQLVESTGRFLVGPSRRQGQ